MEHEFVPGKRRCRNCGTRRKDLAELGVTACEGFAAVGSSPSDYAPPPEPEKAPQTWHLNVWTSVNGVIFTASAEANDEVTNGQALQEKMVGSVLWAVKEITAEYTPTEETE